MRPRVTLVINVTEVNIGAVTDANRPRHARHEPEFDDEFNLVDDDSTDHEFIDDRESTVTDPARDRVAGAGPRAKSWRREAPVAGTAGAAGVTGAAGTAGAAEAADTAGHTGSAGYADAEGAMGAERAASKHSRTTDRSGSTAVEPDKQGPPLRGLAMILLAVGVLLVGWGAYSLFGDNDDAKNTAQNQTAENNGQPQQADPAGQPGQTKPGDLNQNGQNADGNGEGDKNSQDPNKPGNPNDPNKPAPGDPAERDPNAAGAPGAVGGGEAQGVVNKENEYVTVLNNSPIQGLAGDTANKLKGKQWAKTGYGNLADTSGTFPNSVVLYPGNNPNARAAAEQIARDLGVKAQQRDGRIDDTLRGAKMLEGGAPAAVVVVTTNDMPR